MRGASPFRTPTRPRDATQPLRPAKREAGHDARPDAVAASGPMPADPMPADPMPADPMPADLPQTATRQMPMRHKTRMQPSRLTQTERAKPPKRVVTMH